MGNLFRMRMVCRKISGFFSEKTFENQNEKCYNIPVEKANNGEDNDRKELYKRLLAGSDPAQLMHMIQTVYLRRKQRLAQGKRLHVVDEYFFKDAEQILYNEFQYVLQLESKEALMDYILSRMEKRSE